MPYNTLPNISLNSSLYPINNIVPQAVVHIPDNPSFTSKIKTATHSTEALASAASARAYTAYSSFAYPPANSGIRITSTNKVQKQLSGQKPLSPQDLARHHFILQSVNGKPFIAPNNSKPPELSFNDKLQVSGVMGNNFSGQASLNGDQLKTNGLAMTRMLSSERQLNNLDNQLRKMLNAGVQIGFDGYQLTLKRDQQTLIYHLAPPTFFYLR